MKEFPHIACPTCGEAVPESAVRYLRNGFPIECPSCKKVFVPGGKRGRIMRWVRRAMALLFLGAAAYAGYYYRDDAVAFWKHATVSETAACTACGAKGIVPCRQCEGRGRVAATETKECDACNGTGQRPVGLQKSGTMPCSKCSQTGKITVAKREACRACDGKGSGQCDSCKGTGKTALPPRWKQWRATAKFW